MTLSGENIQTLTIGYEPVVEINDALTSAVNAMPTSKSKDRTITIDAADVIAGHTFKVSSTGGTGTAFSVTHTVTTTDTAATVAAAITAALRADSTVGADMRDASKGAVADAAGVVTIKGTGKYGDSTVAVEISAVPAIFGTAATHFASIKLDSVNNNPIKIDLGDSAAANAVAGHGFIGSNVGRRFRCQRAVGRIWWSCRSVGDIDWCATVSQSIMLSIHRTASRSPVPSNHGAINNLSSISNAAWCRRILDADFARRLRN